MIDIGRLIDTDQISVNLQFAGAYLVVYELLKGAVLDVPKKLIVDGIITSDDYAKSVLVLHRDPFIASSVWLEQNGAIDKHDLDTLRAARSHRNELAHELLAYISSDSSHIDTALFPQMCNILFKVDHWMAEAVSSYRLCQTGETIYWLASGRQVILSILLATFHDTETGQWLKKHMTSNLQDKSVSTGTRQHTRQILSKDASEALLNQPSV